jgi:hypothetical protein
VDAHQKPRPHPATGTRFRGSLGDSSALQVCRPHQKPLAAKELAASGRTPPVHELEGPPAAAIARVTTGPCGEAPSCSESGMTARRCHAATLRKTNEHWKESRRGTARAQNPYGRCDADPWCSLQDERSETPFLQHSPERNAASASPAPLRNAAKARDAPPRRRTPAREEAANIGSRDQPCHEIPPAALGPASE